MNYQIKDIEGFQGYRVDTEGNVWSCKKPLRKKLGKGFEVIFSNEWKIRKPSHGDTYGHLVINFGKSKLTKGGAAKQLHRLVAQAFIPNPNNYPVVCHNDGNPKNNHVENLRWDTYRGNVLDRAKHGRNWSKAPKVWGEKNHFSKLNDQKVKLIRLLHAQFKWKQKNIAAIFSISSNNISEIVRRKTWKHLTNF